MRWPRIILVLIVLSVFGAFFHYTLPQRDIVRIVETEVILTELDGWNRVFYASPDSGSSGVATTRDVRFITTVYPDEEQTVMVFRNEDTGILWPPYFKFDSQDLHTEASNLRSTAADPQWVAITHYGWRNNFFTIYPNALAIEPVESPDVRLIPWFNITFLVLLFAAYWAISVRVKRFWENRIEPLYSDD